VTLSTSNTVMLRLRSAWR